MRVAMMMSRHGLGGGLASGLAKARWILIYGDDRTIEFVRNFELTARGAVKILRRHGCTDVVFAGGAAGGLASLKAAGIRGWYGKTDETVFESMSKLRSGQLPAAHEPEKSGSRRSRRRRRRSRAVAPRAGSHRYATSC